jgi:hypothetical protein
MLTHLFGNPAILFKSGSVALRHQITLVLPVRRTSDCKSISGHCAFESTRLLKTVNKKGALTSAKDESAPCVGNIPDAKMLTHLFGNPAVLYVRTRGFASPDYSGFARSENVYRY